jgi:hypothetical protein
VTDLSTAEQRAEAISLRRELELLRQRHGEWCGLSWPHEGPCVQRLASALAKADAEVTALADALRAAGVKPLMVQAIIDSARPRG